MLTNLPSHAIRQQRQYPVPGSARCLLAGLQQLWLGARAAELHVGCGLNLRRGWVRAQAEGSVKVQAERGMRAQTVQVVGLQVVRGMMAQQHRA